MPQYGRPDGENMNDDRLQHILNEMPKAPPTPQQQMAQQLHMQQQQMANLHMDDSQHSDTDSKSPNGRDVASPFSIRRAKKYDNDDIPQDKIAKIYQEEFAKLMRAPPRYV
jgi:homeobox protein cut-like